MLGLAMYVWLFIDLLSPVCRLLLGMWYKTRVCFKTLVRWCNLVAFDRDIAMMETTTAAAIGTKVIAAEPMSRPRSATIANAWTPL